MSYHKLLTFNNFAGVCYIKITKNNEWIESRFFKYYGFVKTFFIILALISFITSKEFKDKMFRKEAVELNQYSKFSKIILNVAVQCFYMCGLILIFTQYFRRTNIMIFLKQICDFELTNSSKIKLAKACSYSIFINVGIFAISVLVRNLRILKNDYLPTYILWFLSSQLYLIIVTVFTLFCHFQLFILTALREIKENLQDSVLNSRKFEKSLQNLIKIENFFEKFEENFGFQLTLVSVNYVFSIVTFVSFYKFIFKF